MSHDSFLCDAFASYLFDEAILKGQQFGDIQYNFPKERLIFILCCLS